MRAWKIAAGVGGSLIVALLLAMAFALGIHVGELGADRAQTWSRLPLPLGVPLLRPGGHGIIGHVQKVEAPSRTIVVLDADEHQHPVLLGDDTVLVRSHERIELPAVQVGEAIVVIGAPDESGRIVARAVRILPAPRAKTLSRWSQVADLLYRAYRLAHMPFRLFGWRIASW